MSQDIVFKVKGIAAELKLNFRYEDSLIQPKKKDPAIPISEDKIDISSKQGELKIKIDVGRNGRESVADWYNKFVKDNTLHMVHTKGGNKIPEKLNFALKGWLTIGEEEYHVCFGQGHNAGANNWHLCSYDILARANNKSAYLDNIYYIDADGSHEFTIIYADEINKGKGITLWASTNSDSIIPRFDMEGDTLHPFPYKQSNLSNVGEMQKGKAYDTSGIAPLHRDFHLQVISSSSNSQLVEVIYSINRETGTIGGPNIFEQTVKRYTNESNITYLMNYGMSHAAQPLTNQSYIYTAPENRNWMEKLAIDCPDIKIKDLVLPGSHDAGMYEMNGNLDLPVYTHLVLDLLIPLFPICANEIKIILGMHGTRIALENLSITQKDDAYNQMKIGTRYFDFRPAYDKSDSEKNVYHVHGIVPGVQFKDFLEGINKYLEEHQNEIAIIRISYSGIDKHFEHLDKTGVEKFLKEYISDEVGYDLPIDFKKCHDQSLDQVVSSGKRLLVLCGSFDDNNSYTKLTDPSTGDEYNPYEKSLNDPKYVIEALNSTIKKTGNYDYTVLQLQDTGSGALAHYVGYGIDYCESWANDILGSETGNILQATKPIFDHATYQWLTEDDVIKGIVNQNCPVFIQNDFVDVALTNHGIALSKKVYEKRSKL
jgi:hypothetical protein